MNVVKYSIEAFINSRNNQIPITDLMTDYLKKNLHYSGDYEKDLSDQWNNLPYEGVKSLYSHKYLIGYFTKNKIQIFLFRNDITGMKPKNSCSIDVLTIGDLGINNLVNDSFTAITKIFGKIKCDYIRDSKIFLFPYDNTQKDIWSPELKIKADYDPPYRYDKKDFIRIIIVTVLTLIFLISYLLTPSTIIDQAGKSIVNNTEIIYRSLFISCLFYLIIDSLVNLLIPYIFYRKKKSITIKDLSNFIELTDENPFCDLKSKKKLSTPLIPE